MGRPVRLAPVADSRSVILRTLAQIGVVEVSVISNDRRIENPAVGLEVDHSIRYLWGTTNHPPRISKKWRNFSIRASCLLILDPQVLWQTWSTCPSVSVRPQHSQAVSASGRPLAALFLVATVAPLIWIACIYADTDIKAVPSDTHECTYGTPALDRRPYPSAELYSCSARASFTAGAEVTVESPTLIGSPHLLTSSEKDGYCWVIDASVVADNADLDNAHMSKCTKYDNPAVRDWCQSNWPSSIASGEVRFGALIFNWRGVMSPRSVRMCLDMGITKGTLKSMACCVEEWGWRLYHAFNKCTATW